jgi:hypothetical protein
MSAHREIVPDFASLHPGYDETATYLVCFGC